MGIRAHTPDEIYGLQLQMAFNTYLQCLVFGLVIMAVSQVDGNTLGNTVSGLQKCRAGCVSTHGANVVASANCQQDCVKAASGAGGAAITSFTVLLSLAIGLFAM